MKYVTVKPANKEIIGGLVKTVKKIASLKVAPTQILRSKWEHIHRCPQSKRPSGPVKYKAMIEVLTLLPALIEVLHLLGAKCLRSHTCVMFVSQRWRQEAGEGCLSRSATGEGVGSVEHLTIGGKQSRDIQRAFTFLHLPMPESLFQCLKDSLNPACPRSREPRVCSFAYRNQV